MKPVKLRGIGHFTEPIDFNKMFLPRFFIETEEDLLFTEEFLEGGFLGLPGLSDNGLLAMLSMVPDKINTYVTLEYTELVEEGYVSANEDLTCNPPIGKIILTEGVTDRRFLESAIKILAPHLARNISFLDFDEFKLQGSASELVKTIKAFSAAGLTNNMVAIFDNDTAAKDAQKALKDLKLGKNFRIVNLPDIELLNDYPTVGPQGTVSMNVNGLAGSIELYFPHEALRDLQGQLFPVMWKGYIEGQKQYQGEVFQKNIIQKNFTQIIDRIEKKEASTKDYSFDNLRIVINTIFGFELQGAQNEHK